MTMCPRHNFSFSFSSSYSSFSSRSFSFATLILFVQLIGFVAVTNTNHGGGGGPGGRIELDKIPAAGAPAVPPAPGAPGGGGAPPSSVDKCQEITIPMCKGIGYNYTEMPNPFNHDSQEEAGMEVHQYWPLVEIKCSTDLKFFICSLYVPICMEDYVGIVPPCRSVCERAKYGCEPVMVQYGFPWPERMQCDRFPKYGKGNICMDEKNGESPPPPTAKSPTPPLLPSSSSPSEPKQCSCSCKPPLVKSNYTDHIINGVHSCALPCHGGYQSVEERTFATWWLSLWSGLCCAITFITFLTFLIDPDRFKYPERPIVYLSACYMMVSIGYLIRLYHGHDSIACEGAIVRYSVQIGRNTAAGGGAATAAAAATESQNGNIYCILVFLFIYYFTMASSIWWVILALTWYLAAGCKWSTEAITAHAHLFHVVCWVLPAIGTLIAIMDGAIDGDAIAGICLIGNQDPLRLLVYIVGPLSVSLVVGTGFLLAGFIALVRIREVIASQGGRSKTEKLEKLMIRIGVFSVLYTLPASAVIAAYFYETSAKSLWLESVTCSCRSTTTTTVAAAGSGGGGGGALVEKPLYSVLMLKNFMSLAVGITSGVWIWSGKTVESWQRFLHLSSSGGRNKDHPYHQQQPQYSQQQPLPPQQQQRMSGGGPSFNPLGNGSTMGKYPSHV